MEPFPFQMSEYSQNIAEVPSDLLHLQELDYWAYSEELPSHSPLKPQRDVHGPGHVPIPKSEPEYFPDYLENLPPSSWYSRQTEGFVPMAANFQTTTPTDQSLQLQISEPPTPAAECQVTSTNLSPLPHSPYSPHSEGSFDDGDGFESGLMDPSGLSLTLSDTDPISLKGLTEEQLVSLTARDLNRLCRDMPEDVIKQLKKRRRTLKNRGYAYNSRIRRVTQKNGLEVERDDLQTQLTQLAERCKLLEQEAKQWKQRAQALEAGNV
ncbi:transcription factor MafB-like [Halichondria panicea]|uniref:transcription factor MafB-like n=1 Tax=Halichondria panicea TaxID=6063 RepID=UPI00312B73BA